MHQKAVIRISFCLKLTLAIDSRKQEMNEEGRIFEIEVDRCF